MKRFNKILSLVLALALLASLMMPCLAADKTSYLVLGDSIGAGTGLVDPDHDSFGAIVAYTEGYSYTNYARNGYTTKYLLNYLNDPEVENAVKESDIISISIGGNDFLHSDKIKLFSDILAKGDFTMAEEISQTAKENLSLIVRRIHKINPNTKILVQTLYNPQNGTPFQAAFEEATGRLKNSIVACYNENPGEFEIVDVREAFSGRIALINFDTIHPNAAGHRLIAEAVIDRLNELDLGDATSADFSGTSTGGVEGAFSSVFGYISDFFTRIFDFFAELFK